MSMFAGYTTTTRAIASDEYFDPIDLLDVTPRRIDNREDPIVAGFSQTITTRATSTPYTAGFFQERPYQNPWVTACETARRFSMKKILDDASSRIALMSLGLDYHPKPEPKPPAVYEWGE